MFSIANCWQKAKYSLVAAACALFLAVPQMASATDPVYFVPMTFDTLYTTQLTAWVVAFITIAIALFFLVMNASLIFWFIKKVVYKVLGWGRI